LRLLLSTLLLVLCSAAHSTEWPPGWREPSAHELNDSNDDWRKDSKTKYSFADGEFFGPGASGHARLLVRKDGKTFGLLVKQQPGSKWRVLIQMPLVHLQSMGVDRVDPGNYPTACGKGYWECKPGEPAELKLKNDAVLFFADGSAASAFVWSPRTKTFDRIWLSD
jgi:hypothetical protein